MEATTTLDGSGDLAKKEILRVENLHTTFHTRDGEVKAVNGLNLSLMENTILGVVGESGSGKSVSALSILRLVPPPGKITAGSIYFEGVDILQLDAEPLRRIRGKEIAMIFQEPTTALNPLARGCSARYLQRVSVVSCAQRLLWQLL